MNNQRILFLKVFLFAALSTGSAQANQAEIPQLLTPNEAIAAALAEPLKFVGSFISSSSISRIPSCLFRNSKVTVKYTYCRQKEAPALGLTIYSRDSKRGHVTMYAEGPGAPVSELNRREYLDARFRIISRENMPGYKTNFSAKDYAAYQEKELHYHQIGCQIWQWSTDHSLRVDCIEPYKPQEKVWVDTSIRFWIEPNAQWYELQNVLRSAVAKTAVP